MKLKELRRLKGWSREELCEQVRLGGNNRKEDMRILVKIEDGIGKPTGKQAKELAEALGVKKDLLFDKIKENNKVEWIAAKQAAKILGCRSSTVNSTAKYHNIEYKKKANGNLLYNKKEIKKLAIKTRKTKKINKPKNAKYFEKKMRELKKKTELSERELANEMDVSKTNVNSWINVSKYYGNFPSAKNLEKICDYFDVEPEYFSKKEKKFKNNKSDNTKKSTTKFVKEIINYLNNKADTHYRATTIHTKKLINARLREDFTIEDFKTVIDKKVKDWKGTDMEKYLRPNTLFRSDKFEDYLNQKIKNKEKVNEEYIIQILNDQYKRMQDNKGKIVTLNKKVDRMNNKLNELIKKIDRYTKKVEENKKSFWNKIF